MSISEFVAKYREELGISYHAIYTLIESGKLLENVHYKKQYRGTYSKPSVIESGMYRYLKTGK